MTPDCVSQRQLFARSAPSFDARFASLRRIHLDETAWIDLAPAWVGGADGLFEQVLHTRTWAQRSRMMYDHHVTEPRMTSPWSLTLSGPLEPALVDEMREALSARYGVVFDTAGFNLYRDGRDSVAWHRDRIRKEVALPVVPLVSLGEPRKLLFRPYGGGRSRAFALGLGDLLVTGGATQRTWEHAVPKVARAGPRISIAFRHGMDPRSYGELTSEG
ncbi:MAG: alpha-ketoglutarate-dependent dioxygenase AlkB [Myxococcota bacterium]|nr:alpha-ketoglutarate-dependent dioxygenase AlkB [Myxococcota bacterium]